MHSLKEPNTRKKGLLLTGAVLILLFCGCVIQTPQTRIADNPAAFAALTPGQQELVSQGLIDKGMPKSGVLLALGRPDRQTNGYNDGASFERWDYTSLRPVYTEGFFGSYYNGCGYRHGYGFGYTPTVQYIPQRDASIWFRHELVEAWDRVSSPYGY